MLSGDIELFTDVLYALAKKARTRTFLDHGSYGNIYAVSHGMIEKQFLSKELQVTTLREISALNYFNHPFVISPFSIKKGSIILEQADCDLEQYTTSSLYYPVIMYQILEAMKYINENGFIYRDLRPENILVFDSYFYPLLKVADAGQCRVLGGTNGDFTPNCSVEALFIPGMNKYTRNYDQYLDRWALASVFYWLYTKQYLPRDYEDRLRELPIDSLIDDIVLRRAPYEQLLEHPVFDNGYVWMVKNDHPIPTSSENNYIYEFPEKEEKLRILRKFFNANRMYLDPYIVSNCVSILSRVDLPISSSMIVESVIDIVICLYMGEELEQSTTTFEILQQLDYNPYYLSRALDLSLSNDIFSFLFTLSLLQGDYEYSDILRIHDFCHYRPIDSTVYIRELFEYNEEFLSHFKEEYYECLNILYKTDGY